MIADPTTGQVQTMSRHPHDNWMGPPWTVVPAELEEKVAALAPFVRFLTDDAGAITGAEPDEEKRQAALRFLNGAV